MILANLAGRVTVADMPGNAWQIRMTHDQQRFAGGADRDHPPVIKLEPFALIHRPRFGKLDKKGLAAIACQLLAAEETGLIVKCYRIPCGVLVKMVFDGLCDMHWQSPGYIRTGSSVVPAAARQPARRSAIRHRPAPHRFPD